VQLLWAHLDGIAPPRNSPNFIHSGHIMLNLFKRDEKRLCINCKHFQKGYMCARFQRYRKDLVHGENILDGGEYAYRARRSIFDCGPSGRFYEEKSE